MKNLLLPGLLLILFTLTGCERDVCMSPNEPISLTFEFTDNTNGWVGDFADYPNDPNVEDFYKLEFSHAKLPSPLNGSDGALRQSGKNHSDDLFMFIKKKITGLNPNTNYSIELEIEFATNAASGAVGVGGAPGESVFIKTGASTTEPMKVLNPTENHYRMNIDKGNQSIDGKNMQLIGDFANGTESFTYILKSLRTKSPVEVTSNSNGELWIIAGTDSGFEATTTIYYNRIDLKIK
jgi:hypothetical protein